MPLISAAVTAHAFLQLTRRRPPIPRPSRMRCSAAGAASITLEDAADDPVLEPRAGNDAAVADACDIKALFDATPIATRARDAALRSCSAPAAAAVASSTIADRAWEREWLKDFRPMRFGQRLWICPGGQRPQPTMPPTRRACIELDPGLAFGTGTHPTTALCLEWLDGATLAGQARHRLRLRLRRARDRGAEARRGCGARGRHRPAGAASRRATTPRATASRDRLTVARGRRRSDAPADILLANILAEPLLELAPSLRGARRAAAAASCCPASCAAQAAPVASRYAAWFDIGPATFAMTGRASTASTTLT